MTVLTFVLGSYYWSVDIQQMRRSETAKTRFLRDVAVYRRNGLYTPNNTWIITFFTSEVKWFLPNELILSCGDVQESRFAVIFYRCALEDTRRRLLEWQNLLRLDLCHNISTKTKHSFWMTWITDLREKDYTEIYFIRYCL